MKIEVEQITGETPVTIMKLQGELDAASYNDVIDKAKELHQDGMRHLLLDLGEMSFMSSSGLVALHSIAMLLRDSGSGQDTGWGAMQPVASTGEVGAGFEAACKLLNPQPRVEKTLNITGFSKILETFTDRDEAIASFT